MATAPSPNDLTRQQLDELDALLQRMLSLPLSPSEPPSASPASAPVSAVGLSALPLPEVPLAPAAKNWRVDPPMPPQPAVPYLAAAPVAVPTPEVRRTPEPAPVVPAAPLRSTVSWVPEPGGMPVSDSVPAPPAPNPAPRPATAPVPPPAAKPLPIIQPQVRPTAHRPQSATIPDDISPIFWPIVALNSLLEMLLGLFGPPGRLLRTSVMKNLLGVTGMGLLLYTILHVAQIRGWLSLPMELPWPR